VLLVVALLALIAGSVFLFMEIQDYGSPPYQGAPSAWVMPHHAPDSLGGAPLGSTLGPFLG
jgi:hypothetical protein